jgi:glutamate-1-semialdehyde 2,1-aminomutase
VAAAGSIEQEYRAKFSGSAELWERARAVSPSGVHHDLRRVVPFPVYVARALGSRKWDVDGHEILDLATGHGGLILGHGHPEIVRALQEQAATVTHASAPTALEVQWAENVTRIVPCAEMVRFVNSGTEATMLAMRLARGHTGRPVIVRFQGHFHGWHDYAMLGYLPPFDLPTSSGIPDAASATVRSVPLHDLGALEEALEPGDVAAVILEADGPRGGSVPVAAGFLAGCRELSERYGTVLIFDEVVTGFRLAPGGAQQYYGVIPDLATFAKSICAGAPAGAVAGRASIMSDITFRDDPGWNQRGRVRHQGTFSANPLSAAVGVVATNLLADGSVQDHCARMADRLRDGFNAVYAEERIGGCLYGTRSTLRNVVGDDLPDGHDPAEFTAAVSPARLLENVRQPLLTALQQAQLLEGIDFLGGSNGWTSLAWTEADAGEATLRFARALRRLIAEGFLARRRKRVPSQPSTGAEPRP